MVKYTTLFVENFRLWRRVGREATTAVSVNLGARALRSAGPNEFRWEQNPLCIVIHLVVYLCKRGCIHCRPRFRFA